MTLLAFVAGWRGRTRISSICFLLSLTLATGLFLYEVYSPEYGFRMPWLQTRNDAVSAATRRG